MVCTLEESEAVIGRLLEALAEMDTGIELKNQRTTGSGSPIARQSKTALDLWTTMTVAMGT